MLAKSLCFGAIGIGTLYAASKLVDRVYTPAVRRYINEPFIEYPQRDLYKSAVLSKLAYEDNVCEKPMETWNIYNLENSINPVSFYEDPVLDAQAYMWQDTYDSTLFIVFRGTEHEKDVIADIDVRTVRLSEYGSKIRVHSGFYRQFMSLKDKVWSDIATREYNRIVFAGHSLGAALATLASFAYASEHSGVQVECYTVGSPRVGNEAFVKEFARRVSRYYRVFNENDPVAMIPISRRFCHIDNGICIDDGGRFYNVPRDDPWFVRPFLGVADVDAANLISDHDCKLYIERLSSRKEV